MTEDERQRHLENLSHSGGLPRRKDVPMNTLTSPPAVATL
jgi:hypothetical protein